jgi:hypothetical protein
MSEILEKAIKPRGSLLDERSNGVNLKLPKLLRVLCVKSFDSDCDQTSSHKEKGRRSWDGGPLGGAATAILGRLDLTGGT